MILPRFFRPLVPPHPVGRPQRFQHRRVRDIGVTIMIGEIDDLMPCRCAVIRAGSTRGRSVHLVLSPAGMASFRMATAGCWASTGSARSRYGSNGG